MRIARLAVTEGFSFTAQNATRAVEIFLSKLTSGTDWVTASGCFVKGKFPVNKSLQVGWNSRKEDQDTVFSYGDAVVTEMMTPSLKKALKAKAKYFSFGIDLKEKKIARHGNHAELFFVWDCQEERIVQRCGKTYPCGNQENTLYHVTDYSTHFMEALGERIMILGCNDLNMFNPRGKKAQKKGSHRYRRMGEFQKAAKAFKPTVVLQHPHFSDTHNIWYMKWCTLNKMLKPKSFSSAICYGRWPEPGKPVKPIRGSLEDVLAKTHGGCLKGNSKKMGQSLWPIQDILVSHGEVKNTITIQPQHKVNLAA